MCQLRAVAPETWLGAALNQHSDNDLRIKIWFPGDAGSGSERPYRVAGRAICSNQPIHELTPFEVRDEVCSGVRRLGLPARDFAPLPDVYDGKGWVGGREIDVLCQGGGDRYCLRFEPGGELTVEKANGEVSLRTTLEASDKHARLAILGPGLALALALGGDFSFHASAISTGRCCTLILGESGAGKSTLAAHACNRPGLRRVADDVVPTELGPAGQVVALPRFPQLKLPALEQWLGEQRLPVDTICFLRRGGAVSEPRLITLSARESVLRLVENTVASRLFDADLRVRHLDACVLATEAARIVDLEMPDDLGRLDETLELLESDPP